ncbi:2,3-diaminopropionate biosynthesis protein SbnB [Salinispora pacifica]|uniref:2,3-diaminopropionate biosynthesis protein SbnB n=1 Tax=Salinispora pacifica TaxID=351187 RepID=UPI0004B3C59F|nr:2,3-diaminopropionate biosynthesis protein SbnB [Salinispora pacifica]
MLILRRTDVLAVLDGDEPAVCRLVRDAYVHHADGATAVPHSVFLRFPDDERNRVIALPAYVGGARPVASLKWIASFPGNVDRGRERASAAILLSSVTDGRTEALLEGSVISARRTAASAAVAAGALTAGAPADVTAGVALIGAGLISVEVLRFLHAHLPRLGAVTVFDLDPGRARRFAERATATWPRLAVRVAESMTDALAAHRLVCFATTAARPHTDAGACRPGTVVLHLSLRDLTAPAVLGARNVVDDADHVCRAATSLELAETAAGDRRFIAAELGDLLAGRVRVPYDESALTVFSPFGLGALDAALAAHVRDVAVERGLGVHVPNFAADAPADRVPAADNR